MTLTVEEYLKERAMGCRYIKECIYSEECKPPTNLELCGVYSNWDNL